MPLTAASDTVRSAFFNVSFVASTGPLLHGAVAEMDRIAWKPGAVCTATRVLRRGANRDADMFLDMIDVCSSVAEDSDSLGELEYKG